MQPIAHWLNTLGLGQYAPRFAENYIDASVVRDLTDQDLEKIGIPLGHRKKLLRAIRELADTSPAAPPTATASNSAPHDSAERRQLTVMFTDLVDSTALSPGSTQRICRRSSAPITDVAPRSSPNPVVSSPNIWATACSPISAIRKPMRTMPSKQCARGWRWSKPWRSSI
jgi:hypothetical protein